MPLPHLVRHEGGDGASDLMVVHAGGRGSQQDEEESDGHRDFQDRLQQHRLLQAHKRHGGLFQEVHAAWKTKIVNTQKAVTQNEIDSDLYTIRCI